MSRTSVGVVLNAELCHKHEELHTNEDSEEMRPHHPSIVQKYHY